jgi:hypothetical protein
MAATGLHQQFLLGAGTSKSTRDFTPVMTLDTTVKAVLQPGPDIMWDPSVETFKKRVQRLAAQGLSRATAVPEGFPSQVNGTRVWSGQDLKESQYILTLDKGEIAEIEAALAYFKSKRSISHVWIMLTLK